MARLDQLPDDVLLCILDQAWDEWKEWSETHNPLENAEGSFQRSLLYVNKRFETSVERWMFGRVKEFEHGREEHEIWLLGMLPRPAMHLFIERLGDKESNTTEKQQYRIQKVVHQVTRYLLDEAQNRCSDHELPAVTNKYRKILCALAAAKHGGGHESPLYTAFLESGDGMEQHAIETCSIGGIVATFEGNTSLLTSLSQKKTFDINIDHKFFGNPILVAAQTGNIACMKILLAQPGKTFLYNRAEFNALHLAAKGGDIPMIKLLLEHNDGTLYPPDQEMTALSLAAYGGHLAAVELLLHGLDPPPTTEDCNISITCASGRGHEEVVKLLLQYSSLPSAMGYEFGIEALCIEDGDSEGGDIEGGDSEGDDSEDGDSEEDFIDSDGFGFEDMFDMEDETNMAFLAARHDHENIVRLVLDSEEFEPKTKKTIARLCFRAAAQYNGVKVAQLLLSRFEYLTNTKYMGDTESLAYAAAFTSTGVMKLLLERDDIDVNHANMTGTTAICYSMSPPPEPVCRVTDELEALKLMVARDDVIFNCVDENGDTPLIWAAIAGDPRMVRALMSRKELDVNARNHFGETALSRAILRGNTAVVKVLLTREGIQADAKNKLGLTPFLMASGLGYLDIVELFINRPDVDIEARSTRGRTALWLAARPGKAHAVKYLLHHCAGTGVDLDHPDNEGISPLGVAELGETGGHRLVEQILSERKKNIKASNQANTTQKTPLDEFCCVACLFIHPDAHGVYKGVVPGFSNEQ
ncbi:hypothetical protein FQN49_004930 [Arthroderma sp. PD_2]|nr:hypothetical protein FQN49_004930 [Arthroderma sp. PD_2]